MLGKKILAGLFAGLTLIKLAFLLTSPGAWLEATQAFLGQSAMVMAIYLVLLVITGYFVFTSLNLIDVAVVMLFTSALVGLTLMPYSGAMLKVARGKSPPTVSYVLGNAENLPFGPEAFDCVSASLSLHEMEYHTRIGVAVEMLRVLAPDGRLIVFDYAAGENTKFALALGFLGILERIAGAAHFANFARFTRMGGIGRFLKAFPLRIITTRSYFLGALQLIVAEKSPKEIT